MSHAIFLSYQSGSKSKVETVRRALDANYLTCWMDNRITPGDDWNKIIDQAVASSQVLVLFLTAACEESIYVKHELLNAESEGLTIVPVRLEDFRPAKDPLTRLNRFQYLDAFGGPIEDYLSIIVSTVRQRLADHQRKSGSSGNASAHSRLPGSPVADIGNLVYEAWIAGFLMPTIIGLAAKEGHEEGIDRPYTLLDPKGAALSDGNSKIPLSSLLKRANGKLMISGERGSGKTILMLQLVRDLLPIADNIHHLNAPLYLNVGTWVDPQKPADKQPKIRDWIRSRLVREYHLHPKRAEELIANQNLIYCFDGLDDLCEKRMRHGTAEPSPSLPLDEEFAYQGKLLEAFLAELRDLLSTDVQNVIVTGGPIVENLMRESDLPFYNARINPWNRDDLIRYLDLRGIGALAAFITSHPEIEDRLIKSFSELQMLGTVFQDRDEVQALEDLAREGIDTFFSAVYDKYLKIKYDRYCKDVRSGRVRAPGSKWGHEPAGNRKTSGVRISLTEITKYVTAIASYIGQPGQGESFRLDTLQPYELPKKIQQNYRLYAGILIGAGISLTAGIPVALCIALEWYFVNRSLTNSLTHSLYAIMGYIVLGLVAAIGYRFTSNWGFGGVVGLVFAVGKACASGFSASSPGSTPGWDAAFNNGVAALIAAPIVFALIFLQMGDEPYQIVPIETWDPDTSKIGYWMFGAIALGALFSCLHGLGPAKGVAYGIILAVFAWTRFGKKPKVAAIRLRPNQAILYSSENAFWHTLGLSLTISIVTGVSYGIAYGPSEGILDGVMALASMVVVFFFGGIPVAKHIALRGALIRTRLVSSKLELWLQTAESIGLLRRVGGGYAFSSEDSRRQYASRLAKDKGIAGLEWGLSRLNTEKNSIPARAVRDVPV